MTEREDARRELEDDRQAERRLLWKGLVAVLVVLGLILLRHYLLS